MARTSKDSTKTGSSDEKSSATDSFTTLGAGLGGRLGGFSSRDSLRLGAGMMSRGEVGLIVATAEVDAGLIGDRVFAELVLVVLATTLVTPLVLRALYSGKGERTRQEQGQRPGKGG